MAITLPLLLSDQLPNDLGAEQGLLNRLQSELHLFGYRAVNTPLIEHADLFLIKAGDAAINRLVSFDLTGHTLCIRPEFTAPAARAYIQHFQDQAGAVRLQMNGPILQYENLRHGEITQRDAIGAELINENSPAADAEIIALAARMLDRAALSWSLTIGHSGLIDRFIDRYELDREMRRFVLAALPQLRDGSATLESVTAQLGLQQGTAQMSSNPSRINDGDAELALQALMNATPQRGPNGGRTREEIARRLLEKHQRTDQRKQALQALRDLLNILAHASTPASLYEYLRGDTLEPIAARILEMFDLLGAYNLPPERTAFDLSFTRNLDYYTGVVFEFRVDLPGKSQFLLGGGGRYDELIGLLGAANHVPAVGFMLYLDNLLEALGEADRTTHQEASIAFCAEGPTALNNAIQIATSLRNRGQAVTIDSPCATAYPAWITHLVSVPEEGPLSIQNLLTGEITTLAKGNTESLFQLLENAR